jgi:prophage regulatory protein
MSKRYLRLPQVLERIPVSKSTWWAGVKKGIFPASIKLSPRVTVWLESEIDGIGVKEQTGQLNESQIG